MGHGPVTTMCLEIALGKEEANGLWDQPGSMLLLGTPRFS